jgi:hypothetical protein
MSGDSACSLGTGRVLRDSGKALLVELEDVGEERWIPQSVIHDDSEAFDAEDNSEGEVVVKQWWAAANGLE